MNVVLYSRRLRILILIFQIFGLRKLCFLSRVSSRLPFLRQMQAWPTNRPLTPSTHTKCVHNREVLSPHHTRSPLTSFFGLPFGLLSSFAPRFFLFTLTFIFYLRLSPLWLSLQFHLLHAHCGGRPVLSHYCCVCCVCCVWCVWCVGCCIGWCVVRPFAVSSVSVARARRLSCMHYAVVCPSEPRSTIRSSMLTAGYLQFVPVVLLACSLGSGLDPRGPLELWWSPLGLARPLAEGNKDQREDGDQINVDVQTRGGEGSRAG